MKLSYIKSITIAGMLLLTTACTKSVLDKTPVSSFSAEGFYKTPSDAQAGVNGIYNAAQSVFRTNFSYWGEGRADNVQTAQSGEGLTLTQNTLNSSAASADWTAIYTMISRANYAIKYIPGVFGANNTAGNQLLGQAKALRALAYFYLVRVWGDVPLITEPYTSAENIFVSRKSQDSVLNQVEADLQYAAANCVTKFGSNNDRIMFTQGSANALLTEVYMWRRKYADALATSSLVLNNSLYSLVTTMDDWSKIFTASYSKESIFEVGYNATQTNSLRILYAIGSYAIFTPSAKFKASYEPGDQRIIYVYDTTKVTPLAIWKFLGKGVSDEVSTPSLENIVLIRLADIMLLRAEALVQTGGASNTTEALTLLNKIRTRAGLPAFNTEADANAMYGDMESAILHERSIELCFEGQRWFDLVRTGRAISTMQPLNGLSDQGNLVWPIYVDVLNRNPSLEQNAYYK